MNTSITLSTEGKAHKESSNFFG